MTPIPGKAPDYHPYLTTTITTITTITITIITASSHYGITPVGTYYHLHLHPHRVLTLEVTTPGAGTGAGTGGEGGGGAGGGCGICGEDKKQDQEGSFLCFYIPPIPTIPPTPTSTQALDPMVSAFHFLTVTPSTIIIHSACLRAGQLTLTGSKLQKEIHKVHKEELHYTIHCTAHPGGGGVVVVYSASSTCTGQRLWLQGTRSTPPPPPPVPF